MNVNCSVKKKPINIKKFQILFSFFLTKFFFYKTFKQKYGLNVFYPYICLYPHLYLYACPFLYSSFCLYSSPQILYNCLYHSFYLYCLYHSSFLSPRMSFPMTSSTLTSLVMNCICPAYFCCRDVLTFSARNSHDPPLPCVFSVEIELCVLDSVIDSSVCLFFQGYLIYYCPSGKAI